MLLFHPEYKSCDYLLVTLFGTLIALELTMLSNFFFILHSDPDTFLNFSDETFLLHIFQHHYSSDGVTLLHCTLPAGKKRIILETEVYEDRAGEKK